MMKILIDAGHYGQTNKSPCNSNYYESKMTWKLQTYLISYLEKYDCEIGVTRQDQTKDLAVFNRGQKAKGYDLFLSLHSNAVGSYVKDGCDRPVVIYPILNKNKQNEIALKFANEIAKVMETNQQGQIMTRPLPNSLNTDYYGVIRGAVSVGCENAFILEHSFHTDTRATNWLLVEENLIKLAKAEAKLIASIFNLKEREEEDMARYNKVSEIEDRYWREYATELINRGVLRGDENGNLDITIDMLRIIKMIERIK